tara:strand:+ start:520 stop:1302 length:783 start_codon:yes stop_codon:yes gene_type:complete
MRRKEKYLEKIKRGINCTNSYESGKVVSSKIEKNGVLFEEQSSALLFIEKTRYKFWRFYFYIQDITQIDWAIFKEKTLIAEIVIRNSKKEKWLPIIQAFQEMGGFKVHDVYDRYFKEQTIVDVTDIDFSSLEKPNNEDFDSIQQLIELNFSPHTDKIPSVLELKEFRETTFIIKNDLEIVAFFITEKKGVTLEFRYWLVLEEFRGRRYGNLLMKRVLSFDPEIKRVTSWIRQGNDNVIHAHKQMGFKEDGLTNYILHREK